MGMDPKALRAEAKRLIRMAQMIEMAQDPQKALKKKVTQQVAGAKRRLKYGVGKSITAK